MPVHNSLFFANPLLKGNSYQFNQQQNFYEFSNRYDRIFSYRRFSRLMTGGYLWTPNLPGKGVGARQPKWNESTAAKTEIFIKIPKQSYQQAL